MTEGAIGAVFSVHFDGPITVDHKVSLRVMAKTYEHVQRAIDRAYLLEVRGQIFHALHPFHTAENVQLYVAPLMEAGGFDVHGGDLYFLGVAE